MKRYGFLCLILIMAGCSAGPPLNDVFETAQGKSVKLTQYLEDNTGLVILYLSPECPLCQNYAVAIRELEDKFRSRHIDFIGVVSGNFYPRDEVVDYAKTYQLHLDILMDPDFVISDYYRAQLTPEAHLINKEGKLLYRGAIDNWAISLGKKRIRATAHYLSDALVNFLSGKRIDPKVTEPVGCYIE